MKFCSRGHLWSRIDHRTHEAITKWPYPSSKRPQNRLDLYSRTLDDCEAATIVYAIAQNAIPLADERRANRLCAERFPQLRVGCTVDIFTHPEILQSLGTEALADAVFNTLSHGRMRVFPHHIEWVIGLIGTECAALCTSLPGSVRLPLAKAARAKSPA